MKNTLFLIGGILSASISPSILNSENLHKAAQAVDLHIASTSSVRTVVSADVSTDGVLIQLTEDPAICRKKTAEAVNLCQ